MSEHHFRKLMTFLKKIDRAQIHYTFKSRTSSVHVASAQQSRARLMRHRSKSIHMISDGSI